METKYYTVTEKNEIKNNFLYIPKKFKKYLGCKNIFWIYKIINYKDNRVYVGKTSDINRRALNYVNEYLKGDISRTISKAFQDIGFNNFMMFPLEIAFNDDECGYKMENVSNFFNYYEKASDRII